MILTVYGKKKKPLCNQTFLVVNKGFNIKA